MTKSDMILCDMMRVIMRTFQDMHGTEVSPEAFQEKVAAEIMILQIGSYGYEHVKTLMTDPKEIAYIEFMENSWNRIDKDWDRK